LDDIKVLETRCTVITKFLNSNKTTEDLFLAVLYRYPDGNLDLFKEKLSNSLSDLKVEEANQLIVTG
jgi:hypothetical protein